MSIEISDILYNTAMFFVVLVGSFIITKFLGKFSE